MRVKGVIRQSRGREDSLSPEAQQARMEDHCSREGWTLVDTVAEIDVSGGTPLADRQGLGPAVEAVEAGEADVVMVAYFDRLVRSLEVQREVVARVEDAGGKVIAIDFGEVTGRSAAQWLSGTLIGAMSEYYLRSVRERSGEGQARSVAKGKVPFNNIPPGYVRGDAGPLEVDEPVAELIRRAYAMRADGQTISEVRSYLAENGVVRSYHGVQHLLTSRIYIGEINFGKLSNASAHPAIVDRGVWDAVQEMRGVRGTRPKSDRLLARLGVLRCGNCNARMVVGMQTQNGRRYPFYRCPPVGDCTRRVAIGAAFAEDAVTEATRRELADLTGRASMEAEARAAVVAAENAQAELDGAIRAFEVVGSEPAALERLRKLRDARDAADEHSAHLSRLHSATTVNVAENWDRLTVEEQRGFIRDTVDRATVRSGGKGRERITVHLLR